MENRLNIYQTVVVKTAFMSLAFLSLGLNCREPDNDSYESRDAVRINQKKEIIPHISPTSLGEYSSPSDNYLFQLFSFPEVEGCKPLIMNPSYDDPRNPHPCGFSIHEKESKKPVFQYALVESPSFLAIPAKLNTECKDISLRILYGFSHWSDDDKIIFRENILWFGAADWGENIYKFDWSTCKTSLIWKFEEPHCPGLCNSLLFVMNRKHIYLIHYDPEIKTTSIRRRSLANLESLENKDKDFYDDAILQSSLYDKIDPNKSTMVATIPSDKRPNVVSRFNKEHTVVIIDTGRTKYIFNALNEKLE